jgi:hypothetical protein
MKSIGGAGVSPGQSPKNKWPPAAVEYFNPSARWVLSVVMSRFL